MICHCKCDCSWSAHERSIARFTFAFAQHLIGGGLGNQSRGGLTYAPYFEWGGYNAGGPFRYRTRLVRGPSAPTNSPIHRFFNNSNGTITDLDTGLTWQQGEAPALMSWTNLFTTNPPASPFLWEVQGSLFPWRFYLVFAEPWPKAALMGVPHYSTAQ